MICVSTVLQGFLRGFLVFLYGFVLFVVSLWFRVFFSQEFVYGFLEVVSVVSLWFSCLFRFFCGGF